MNAREDNPRDNQLGEPVSDYRLRQRDYVLRIARAMSAQLDPQELLSLVIRSAVTMTGGTAGAIAIRRDALAEEPLPFSSAAVGEPESEIEIVASYHLEPRLVEYVHATSGRPRVTPTAPSMDEAPSQEGRPTGTAAEPLDPRGAPSIWLPTTREELLEVEESVAREMAVREARGASATEEADAMRPAPLARLRSFTPREPQHVLTLPLRFSGEEIGRIVVFRSEGATLFTPVDEELLRSFSDQAAVAIGNALLHERLAQSERRLAGVVEHSPAGILLLDGAGRVRSANAAAESVSGRPRAELVGRLLAEALPLVDEHGRPVPSPLDGSRLAPLSRDAAVAQRSEDGGTRADGVEDAPRRHARRSARGAIARHAPRKSHTEAGGQETGSPANVPLDLRDARWVQLSVTPFDEAGASGDGFVAVVTDLTAWRDAERAKTAFLAGLSHELKTPLSLIRGFAETLGAPELDGEEREAFREHAVEVILDETAHLTRMVDQLLLAARASAGALALDLHEVDVARLAEELVGQFAQTFPALRWKLKAGEAAPIVGDPSRLRDVVANLLSNAAKYAPAATLVEVSVDAAPDGGVLLRVRDEGRGIEAANLTRVFERFWRADETVEGTGLGLYMARAIVAAHGGRIEVEHSEPGRGTTFLVRLPAAPPGGRAALRAIPEEEEESMS